MRLSALALVALAAITAWAPSARAGSPFYELTEAQKRKIVVPDIKALTFCIAREVVNDADAVTYYRAGSFSGYVTRQLNRCPREMSALIELYESTYGDGEAERFIKGAYLSDLPRAVLSVIRTRLDAKVADLQADEQRVRDAEAAQEAEGRRKAEQERLETARLESERAAVEDRARRDKRQRVDTAMGAMGVLRDKFYECVDRQLPGLVKSGESADVLASAAMTICGKPLADVQDAALEVSKAKDASMDGVGESAVRDQIKALVKERVVADAVQAKAGVGAFATLSK